MNDDAIRREPLKKVLENYRHTREYLSDEQEAQNTLLDWISLTLLILFRCGHRAVKNNRSLTVSIMSPSFLTVNL